MDNFDEAMNNYIKKSKEIEKGYRDNMRKIDEKYEKKKRKSNKRTILWFSILLLMFVKNIILINISSNFNSYAIDHSMSIKDNTSEYDKDIIYKRLLPSYLSSFVNPFEWTELQISKDDELLKKCKTVYEIRERERQLKRKEAEITFDERFKEKND